MMIRNQAKKLRDKLSTQTKKILGIRKKIHYKRNFIDGYARGIQPFVSNVSEEEIKIIITGFLSELRQIDQEIRNEIIKESSEREQTALEEGSKYL